MPSTSIDQASGKLYLFNGYYTVGSSLGDQIVHSNEYDLYCSTEEEVNYFVIKEGVQEVTYWTSTINSAAFILIRSQDDVVFNIEGTVKHISTSNYNMNIANDVVDATLTINGDSLILINDSNYKGLVPNTGYDMSGQSIVLNLAYFDIEANEYSIGYDENYNSSSDVFGNLTINDGCVLTATGSLNASTIIIGKASVKSAGLNVTAVNNDGDNVYCVTVPHNGTKTVTVTNSSSSEETYSFEAVHPDDDNYYLYLPNGEYSLTTNGTDYYATVNGADVIATLPAVEGDGTIDVSLGEVSIYEGGYLLSAACNYRLNVYNRQDNSNIRSFSNVVKNDMVTYMLHHIHKNILDRRVIYIT